MIALADNPTTDRTAQALAELARASSARFGYDAVEDKDRRTPPSARTKSEDELLPAGGEGPRGGTRDLGPGTVER